MKRVMTMNLKERAKKLKSDIPAVFIALKDKEFFIELVKN